jgi:uncharacterized damage-inducible protein DinB
MSPESAFLKFSAEKLEQLCGRIETCADKLIPEQIWTRGTENENAVGNLMLHLAGNVRQWILHGVADQPDQRDRDAEFDARGGIPVEQLKHRLRSTVDEAAAVIRSLPENRLAEVRNIQKHYDVTVLEAIYHVVEHFSGHTGQIIFATKLLTGEDLGFYAYLRAKTAHPKIVDKETP